MSTLKTNNIQHVDRSDPSIIINTDGSVNIAGTMTYEDVTNVDSVGIITGRELINAQKQVHVGTGVSVKAGGLNVTAGITTVQALQATTGTFTGDVSIADKIIHTGDTNTAIRFPAADTFTVETAGSEALRVDSSQRLLIGGTSSLSQYGSQSHLQVQGTGFNASTIALRRDQNNANPPGVVFAKSRSGSLGGNTIVQDGDSIGTLVYAAADGTDLTSIAAQIKVEIDGTPGSNDMPGRIVFETTADGASGATERMRIGSNGDVTVNFDGAGNQTGQFIIADGTASAPGLSFWADGSNDTGIFRSGANTLNFTTGGTERLRITSNGEFVMADASTKTFIDLETTGDNTRAIMSAKGKTSGGGDVTLKIGAFGDTARGEIFTHSNHDLGFATNNAATQFKMKTSGNLEIVNGDLKLASGHGIDFSAAGNASGMTSELLDDYEEGTWTPAVQFDVGGSGITYGSRGGTYVKVGRMVHLQYYMHVSGGVSSSDYFARLTLPFSGIAVVHQDARIRQYNNTISDWFVSLGGSGPVFYENNNLGNSASWARGDNVNGVVLSGQYTLYVS